MKQRKIALGPGAASLILIIVALSMCVLCMLTFISARNDETLSARSAQMIETVYTLNARSEHSLAALDAALAACAAEADDNEEYLSLAALALPEGMTLEGDRVYWTESEGDRQLWCAAYIAPLGDAPRAAWAEHYLTVGVEEIWN